MPHGDRTGPRGEGPMTGRGRGYCAGYDAPGYGTVGRGPGWGPGYGRGRHPYGWAAPVQGAGFGDEPGLPPATPRSPRVRLNRIVNLENRADRLERQLADVKSELDRLQQGRA